MDPRRSRLLAAFVAALTLTLPAAAQAGWFPADSVDGPSPDIVAFGGIDVAPQGGAAVVYVKRDLGVPHVFLSRMTAGVWGPPERVDAGINEPAEQPVVSLGDQGQMVVAWISLGRLFVVSAAAGQAFSPPQQLANAARDPHVDIGVNGTAYVVYAADGAGGSDVRAARLQASGWAPIPTMDIAPDQAAGDGDGRPRVAVSAEGFAVAVWGENHPDGRRRIYARRLTGTNLSAYPQEVSMPSFNGAPGGGADSPDIDIEEDGSFAWVAFRQVMGGAPHAFARRLVGSAFEAATVLDDSAAGSAPRVSMNGRGIGLAATGTADGRLVGSLLQLDAFGAPARWDSSGSAAPPQAVVASAANEDAGVAWLRAVPGNAPAEVRGRRHPKQTKDLEEETLISQPAFGPAAPDGRLEMATSRLGDMAVGFLQGAPEQMRLVVATYDRVPGAGYGLTTRRPRNQRRPELIWRPGLELWGPVTFTVYVDGKAIGTTEQTRLQPSAPLSHGKHTWNITTTDRRGQVATMVPRPLEVDIRRPRLSVRISGRRSRGSALLIRLSASDKSKIRKTTIDYGDGSALDTRRTVRRAYFRSGRFKMTVRAYDYAGNVTERVIRMRIR